MEKVVWISNREMSEKERKGLGDDVEIVRPEIIYNDDGSVDFSDLVSKIQDCNSCAIDFHADAVNLLFRIIGSRPIYMIHDKPYCYGNNGFKSEFVNWGRLGKTSIGWG